MLNHDITMMHFAIPILVCLCSLNGLKASAKDSAADTGFREQPVEFHNGEVKLAGSLFLPKSEGSVPAVVFVHGAGQQTREPYREAGEFFASQGIAALIYDKRGTASPAAPTKVVSPTRIWSMTHLPASPS
jgi:poly(3-hydroxybutyrate) depolymerase